MKVKIELLLKKIAIYESKTKIKKTRKGYVLVSKSKLTEEEREILQNEND